MHRCETLFPRLELCRGTLDRARSRELSQLATSLQPRPIPKTRARHAQPLRRLVDAHRLRQPQRLKLELGDAAQEKEKEFWEWTKRPDIQAKLYPNRHPDQIRRDVVAMLDRELLGVRPIDEPEETADPAMLI